MNFLNKPSRLIIFSILFILALTGCTQESNTEDPDEYFPECSVQELINAIDNANADGVPSEIHLPANCLYTLTHVENTFTWNGMTINNGLPRITSEITIRGNNAEIQIQPASNQDPFGHFFLAPEKKLLLYDLFLSDGIRPVGGSVINNQGDLFVYNVKFFDNGALPNFGAVTAQGGAIFNYSGKLRILANSLFQGNFAGEIMVDSPHAGGAVFSINSNVFINNSTFFNNFAAGNGGAVYTDRSPGISGGDLISIQNSVFSENQAHQDGGALSLKNESGGVLIVTSVFADNFADGRGGAIFSQDSDVTNNYSQLYRNEATNGGAVYSRRTADGETSRLTSSNSHYSENSAAENGGGIFSENSDLELIGSTILFNEASSCGGLQLGGYPGMDLAAGDLETATKINSISEISTTSISNNEAITGNGGGACHLMGELIIADSDFYDNTTPSYGGGLLSMDELEITSTAIGRNTAFHGGGLAIGHPLNENINLSPAYLGFHSRITQSWVRDNIAVGQGGGIWVHFGGSFQILKSTIDGNTAGEEGGGVYLNEGYLYVRNNTLAENTAYRGGGIYKVGDGGELDLLHTTVAYNSATDTGNGSRSGGGGINANKIIVMRQVLVVLNANEDCTYGPISVTGGSGSIFDDQYHVTVTNGVDSDGTCIILDTENIPNIGSFNNTYVPIQGGSPLIDRIGANCYSSTDQIGTPRQQGSSCEPGSIEYIASGPQPPPPVPPIPSSGEEESCDPFAGMEISVHLLNINPVTLTLPVYLRFSEEVPGLGDGTMPYMGELSGLVSSLCNQQGFPDRLYCMFTLQPDYPGTLRDLNFYKEDCPDPIFSQPGLTIPEIPSDGPTCRKDLGEKSCKEAGGTWFTGVDDPYCLCP